MNTVKRAMLFIFAFVVLSPTVIFAPLSQVKPKTHTNSLGMEFVLIPAGSFDMGIPKKFKSPCKDDVPRHRVTISQPFYMGRYEVTQEQWHAVMKTNPGKFKGSSNPVERVSWSDVQDFIRKLNEMEKTQAYRLPTEAEWEYASRAGTSNLYCFGDSVEQLPAYAWFYENAHHKTHPVGKLRPNAWGLYDTLGNVWEWCQDVYEKGYYRDSPSVDPQGPASGSCRVLRGGSWHSINPYRLRCCFRFYFPFNGQLPIVGFRLVKSIERRRQP